jgi:hypothetical protein
VSSLHVVEGALAVPMKRFEQPMVGFLTREEMMAVLGRPGKSWTSHRDHLLLALLYNTGARRARRRRGARWRRVRSPPRQGAQATLGTTVEELGAGDPRLAAA